MSREPLIIEPRDGSPANAALILLHGLGADGNDFAPLLPALNLPRGLALRCVLPHAPQRAVTVNGGMRMPAWYDILAMDLSREVDEAQLKASAAYVHELIDAQRAQGIDSRRIVVAGFSQGGAVAFEAALSYPQPLAGLLALSTYFATADSLTLAAANRALPTAVHHGTFDPVVPEQLGRAGYEKARELGVPAEYRSFAMAHALCPEQIGVIGDWLGQRLG